MIFWLGLLAALGALGSAAAASLRVVREHERGVVHRLGRLRPRPLDAGLHVVIPIADRLHKVDMRVTTLSVPAQDGITRDNITVRADAVVYCRVAEPRLAAADAQDDYATVKQVARTSLRSIIGRSDLDALLGDREQLNQDMRLLIDSTTTPRGVQIDRVEIRDVYLPDTVRRSLSRQAEAERERRARITVADGELQASKKLAQAAEVMADHPAALQLRLLQTVVEVAAETNSTLILPLPVDLLEDLEHVTASSSTQTDTASRFERPVDAVADPVPAPDPRTRPVRLPRQAVPHSEPDSLGFMPGQCG